MQEEYLIHHFKLFSEGEMLCLVCHIVEDENLDILISSEKIKTATDNSEIKIWVDIWAAHPEVSVTIFKWWVTSDRL